MVSDIESTAAVEIHPENEEQNLAQKKASCTRLKRYDSLYMESGKIGDHHHHAATGGSWAALLQLAFQSIGVVYGDIGTSPLYVMTSTFPDGIKDNDDIIGVLSIIFYTITLIALVKYVFIVLRANDNGDGGTFALYSLLCRYAEVGLIPSEQAEDRDVSTFKLELPNRRTRRASDIKSKLEKSNFAKYLLLFSTMLGTSMVIGDGVLTPCISVMSAVGGLRKVTHAITDDRIVWISVAILIILFSAQRLGTDKVANSFAPILCIWFAFNSGVGVYNFIKHDPTVIKALNPICIVHYFKRNKKEAWMSLGGTVLSITGAEALFADVGQFSVAAIRLSACCVIYPTLILAYAGQASYLRKHNDAVAEVFYSSIPEPMYWPMFLVAVLAATIASQALITGTFSIVHQSLSLGCFPRVKVVHTSTKYPGQIYIPEVNYLLMVACVVVTVAFRSTEQIGHAYGIAVVFVMTLTSSFLVLIMLMIWKIHMLLITVYILVIGTVELLYLSAVLYKFNQGGYLPLAFSMVLMFIMFTWNHVHRKRYYYELEHKISPEKVKEIVLGTKSPRLPGLAIFYSELAHGIPPIFEHYLANVPTLHAVLVFVSFKSLPISKIPMEERFLFWRVQPRNLQVFQCVVRYGYNNVRSEQEPFEDLLVQRLKEFMQEDHLMGLSSSCSSTDKAQSEGDDKIQTDDGNDCCGDAALVKDVEEVDHAYQCGVVHLVGEHDVMAKEGSSFAKRLLIDYAYGFLKSNLRQSKEVFDIPHKRMLKVGMMYEL